MYNFILGVIKFLVCHVLFRVEYKNLDILEKYDKCMICPNHTRIYDPIFLYARVDNIYSVAKSDIFKNKFITSFLNYHHVMPIKRGLVDVSGAKTIVNTINNNEKIRLLIFPEGGIYKENYIENKRKTKSGAVYMSAMTLVPIIPVHITVRPRYFSKVTVTFLEPVSPNLNVLKDKNLLKEEAKKLISIIYMD